MALENTILMIPVSETRLTEALIGSGMNFCCSLTLTSSLSTTPSNAANSTWLSSDDSLIVSVYFGSTSSSSSWGSSSSASLSESISNLMENEISSKMSSSRVMSSIKAALTVTKTILSADKLYTEELWVSIVKKPSIKLTSLQSEPSPASPR